MKYKHLVKKINDKFYIPCFNSYDIFGLIDLREIHLHQFSQPLA